MPNTGEKGFSLVEVLVAFSLLALVLTVYLSVTASSARVHDRVGDQVRAQIHGEAILAQSGITFSLKDGSYRGVFDDGWRWVLSVSHTGDPPVGLIDPLVLVSIDLEIKTPEGRSVSVLNSLRLVDETTRERP